MICENMITKNMPCEKYRDALTDAAAGEPIDRRLADHLAHCTRCRATLSREQDLFTGIDHALRTRMSETPRADFLTRVHAQIAHEAQKQDAQKQDAQKQSGWNPVWAWAGAALLALAVVVITHPWGRRQQPPVTAENVKAPALPAHESPAIARSVRGPAEHSRRQQHARLDSAQPLHTVQPPLTEQPATVEPEVLVPPDEAKAFAQFVARVAGRDERAQAVVTPMRDQADEKKQSFEIQLVNIADLQVEPLAWDGK